ncbi:ATP-binding protein, partial [Haloferax sp. AB510]|uniref:ATP-binding protein n=1 Tax=Haloferax sp. AB510 TaxID=2934172 RepID=UPI00209C6147
MTNEQSGPAGLPETVTYEPLPSIYRAFAAGATPYAIITETIDNSIDFVRGQALNEDYYPQTLDVDIRFEPIENETKDDGEGEENIENDQDTTESDSVTGRLIITDNAGGVPPEDLAKFFQLGHSDAPPEGIGRFGVGAKRLIGIGNHIRYESHAHGYDVAAGFEVDAQKLEGEAATNSRTAYTSEVYEVDDLGENKTRIIVEDLKKGVWKRLCGVVNGEIDRSAENSLWRLEETYEHFLRDDIKIDPTEEQTKDSITLDLNWGVSGFDTADSADDEVTILNIDEHVSAPEPVDLSYIPFDGLWPRKYEGMPFANDPDTPLDDCLRVDIEVGLLPSSDVDKAGLTVTMNNRNVLFRDTQNDLFSSNYLGN